MPGRRKRPTHPHHRRNIPPYRPASSAQHIEFTGRLTNGTAHREHSFIALAGEQAPTVTGGFAKWRVIDRPQRVGMTVLQGYDPVVLTIQVRFDAVVNDYLAFLAGTSTKYKNLEEDIQILEWMGGRGKLYAGDGRTFAPGQGDSPLVNVFSGDGNGNQTDMIPPNCQDIDYVISGISYDGMPLRDQTGHRIRQDATVTLTQYVGSPGTSYDSPTTLAKQQQSLAGQVRYFPVTRAHNTIRKITTFDAGNPSHAAAVAVLNANKTNPRLKLGPSVDADLTQRLPLGTRIAVPAQVMKK